MTSSSSTSSSILQHHDVRERAIAPQQQFQQRFNNSNKIYPPFMGKNFVESRLSRMTSSSVCADQRRSGCLDQPGSMIPPSNFPIPQRPPILPQQHLHPQQSSYLPTSTSVSSLLNSSDRILFF